MSVFIGSLRGRGAGFDHRKFASAASHVAPVLRGLRRKSMWRLMAAFGLLDRGWGKPTPQLASELPMQVVARKLTYEIVHETQEHPELSQMSGEARRPR